MLIELLVNLAATGVHFMQTFWQVDFVLAIWCERGRAFHFGIPILCPDSIGLARAWWPGQHRIGELHTDRIAQQPQHPLRIAQDVIGINHWWDRGGLLADEIENLRLLPKTDVFHRR